MRIGPLAALAIAAALTTACGRGGLFRQYEYEEDLYLSLDGSATVYVNSSVAALDALRGASFDAAPNARVDRAALRDWYSSAVTHDVRVTTSRRNRRPFVYIRLAVDDVNRLSEAAPFRWSRYRFLREGNLYVFRQSLGAAADREVGDVGWNGSEIVAFRLHLPSKIRYHNAGGEGLKRGNILVWEQPLRNRLRGEPLMLDARMDPQSILYRTLWLFAATFAAVAATFIAVIAWVMRRNTPRSRSEVRPDHVI